MSQTHYRKVYKSDHLGVADLEDFLEQGSKLIFTVKCVQQEYGARVAGKKIDANIAYFNEAIKPLVLNATNAATFKKLTGSGFVENWGGITIQLYIDKNVKMKGDITGGVRIRPQLATAAKPQLKPTDGTAWENAKKAFIRDGNMTKVLARVDMTNEHMTQLQQEAKQGV